MMGSMICALVSRFFNLISFVGAVMPELGLDGFGELSARLQFKVIGGFSPKLVGWFMFKLMISCVYL